MPKQDICEVTLNIYNYDTRQMGVHVAGIVERIQGNMVLVRHVRAFNGQPIPGGTHWYPRNQCHINFGSAKGRRR